MKISIAIVSLLSLAGGAFGENLIYNGGFELGTDGFALHRIVIFSETGHRLHVFHDGENRRRRRRSRGSADP